MPLRDRGTGRTPAGGQPYDYGDKGTHEQGEEKQEQRPHGKQEELPQLPPVGGQLHVQGLHGLGVGVELHVIPIEAHDEGGNAQQEKQAGPLGDDQQEQVHERDHQQAEGGGAVAP